MKRLLGIVVAIAVLAGAGVVVYRAGWLTYVAGRRPQPSAAPPAAAASPHATPASTSAASAAPVAPVPASTAATPEVPTTPAVPPPFEETDVNIALADVGGHVDKVTGAFGPGHSGALLNDGSPETLWRTVDAPVLPCDIVFSFYERQPALVSAVIVVLPSDPSHAPKDVEIWTAPTAVDAAFTRVATYALAEQPGEQKITFPAADAALVKVRILTAQAKDRIELSEIRILEARRAGYTALATRRADLRSWKGSPRQAAQLGLDWLQQAAPDWDSQRKCFGCHVQTQALMGETIGMRNRYVVDPEAIATLEADIRRYEQPDGAGAGSWFDGSTSATQFGALGLMYAHERGGVADDPAYRKAADWLIGKQQPDGSIPFDRIDPPIVQGSIMTSANTAGVFMHAYETTHDDRYKTGSERAVAWIAANEPQTTQDMAFKVLALSRFGTADQRRLIYPILERLAQAQQPDGGWKEVPAMNGSNALATGQVLYALRASGASLQSQVFRRGVGYLLDTQVRNTHSDEDGAWRAVNTQSSRPTSFAHTMWAAIALAGTFTGTATGGLEVVLEGAADKPASRNLEIVLDASGSMKLPLGKSTRWRTALDVLNQVVTALPADFNVGLRVYGHRYSSRSPQTCSDSELVIPPARLDRQRILAVARGLQPRGETPLVRSVLLTADDLRPLGSGSVVLITDGEESCKGDFQAALAQLKASGVPVAVNIVGFTLASGSGQDQLAQFATSTGGRYYQAKSGDALARAVTIAALQGLPFDVLDATGRVVATGQTSRYGLELAPGQYRVIVRAPGQELAESISIAANSDTVLKVKLEGDSFVIER